jgi:hypothetical protein
MIVKKCSTPSQSRYKKSSAQVGCSARGDRVMRERSETRPGGRSHSSTLFSNHNERHNNMAKTQNAKKQTRKAPLKSAKQKKQAKSAKKAR